MLLLLSLPVVVVVAAATVVVDIVVCIFVSVWVWSFIRCCCCGCCCCCRSGGVVVAVYFLLSFIFLCLCVSTFCLSASLVSYRGRENLKTLSFLVRILMPDHSCYMRLHFNFLLKTASQCSERHARPPPCLKAVSLKLLSKQYRSWTS